VGQLRRPAPRRRLAATEGLPRHRLPRRHTPAVAEAQYQQDGRRRGRPPSAAHHRRHAGKLRQPAYRRRRATPRDDHAASCPAATAPRFPPSRRPRRAAREAGFPVGSTRPLRRRAAAKMSPRIRTGPETVLTAHAPPPSAAAATARRKPDQVPIPEQNFLLYTRSRARNDTVPGKRC